jgi:hypothetical protein
MVRGADMNEQPNLLDVAASAARTGATFSPDRVYRYTLWRKWDQGGQSLNFVMLNPSTADETANDPTVERCERRARMMGFGGLVVTNLFALRSTYPDVLYGHSDPVGPDNDAAIMDVATRSGMVVCGWGTHGALRARWAFVKCALTAAGVKLRHLGLTKDGQPRHPLYIGYKVTPQEWL